MTTIKADESGWIEKRHHERVEIRLKTSFKVLAPADLAEAGMLKGVTRDVSLGGVLIEGDLQLVGGRCLEPGTRVALEVWAPGMVESVSALALVAWNRVATPEGYTMGLQFESMEPENLARLRKILRQASGAGG
jgi:c-di-GMP-binding flagellar brake protein YcgR